MFRAIRDLIREVTLNGKSLIVWVLNQWPGLTSYPGLVEALKAFLEEPTQNNFGHLLFQVFWAGAAGHRLLKLLAKLKK